MHIEHFQGKPLLLFPYCSICADLSQETCETYPPEEQPGCCQAHETLRNENCREMFAMTECCSASLCQAGQSGNNSESTSIEMSALPAMLAQLAWGSVSPPQALSLTPSRWYCQNIHLPFLCHTLQNHSMCFTEFSFSVCRRSNIPALLATVMQFQSDDAKEQTFPDK